MNFKKRFEKRIEEDKKSKITESDMAYLATLQDMVVERPEGEVIAKPFNYKKPLLISVACFLVAALTVSLILYYTLFPKSENIFYFEYNFVTVDSDVAELNSDLTLFTFEADEEMYAVKVKRTYDSVSGDTILYILDINNVTQDMSLTTQLEIVVNENYTHPALNYNEEIIESEISGYKIIYTQNIAPEILAGITINTVECMGEMQVGKQWIYVTYYQEVSLAEGTFVETLQSMLHFN